MSGAPDDQGDQDLEPGTMTVGLDNGMVLPVALMMDKDGQVTEVPLHAATILAGSKELGWYEIDVVEQSWNSVTFH